MTVVNSLLRIRNQVFTIGAIAFIVALALLSCSSEKASKESSQQVETRDIIVVMNSHVDSLMSVPGVVGVAVGELSDGTPSIQVLVLKKTEQLLARIPKTIEGHPVVFIETDTIRPLEGH